MTTLDTIAVAGFPHGTVEGFRLGCKSEGACPTGYGQTCVRADRRRSSDWQYGKAFGKGREVEFLEREQAAAAAPAPEKAPGRDRAKANQERAQQRRQGNDTSAATADQVRRGVDAEERPFHAPEPPLPLEPILPDAAAFQSDHSDDLGNWEQPAYSRPARERRGDTEQARRSQGQFAAHAEMREHAIRTATPEHPLGFTRDGRPAKRAAPGTVLLHGELVRRDDLNVVLRENPMGLTAAQQLAAIHARYAEDHADDGTDMTRVQNEAPAESIAEALIEQAQGTPVPQDEEVLEHFLKRGQENIQARDLPDIYEELTRGSVVASAVSERKQPEWLVTAEREQAERDAARQSDRDRAVDAMVRVQKALGTTNWGEVADAMVQVAETVEAMARLGLAIAEVKHAE